MRKATRYPPELRERAIRLVREHRDEHPSESAAIQSIADKLGMTAETLRLWVRRDEVDHGSSTRAGRRGEVHHRAPVPLGSRADLPRVAGRSE